MYGQIFSYVEKVNWARLENVFVSLLSTWQPVLPFSLFYDERNFKVTGTEKNCVFLLY